MGAIKDYIVNFIQIGLEWINNTLAGDMWWLIVVIAAALAILAIIGLIYMIAKTWKVLIVLAILGAIGFAVYYFVWGPGKKPATTTVETIRVYFNFFKALA